MPLTCFLAGAALHRDELTRKRSATPRPADANAARRQKCSATEQSGLTTDGARRVLQPGAPLLMRGPPIVGRRQVLAGGGPATDVGYGQRAGLVGIDHVLVYAP